MNEINKQLFDHCKETKYNSKMHAIVHVRDAVISSDKYENLRLNTYMHAEVQN